ncbi:MAG: hypothetical protein ACI9ZH_002546, partial [Paracoccaceae bacterium]
MASVSIKVGGCLFYLCSYQIRTIPSIVPPRADHTPATR